MSANVGELFVNLGIKGADKTVKSIGEVTSGLGKTASMSLEAKAGILGALYALEQLFATSGRAGTGLTNFNALTKESAKTLQQYQYAGRQAGLTNEGVEKSFISLQNAMTKTLMGEGAPKGLARLGLLTGGINQKDIEEFAKQPEKLIQRLQQYAQRETNAGLRNETLRSFGISDDMIAALSRGKFTPQALNKAPIYSDKEIAALDRANIAWSNLATHIEMAVGHFNAMHGGQIVQDITQIADAVIKLTTQIFKLLDAIKLFPTLGAVTKEITGMFEAVTDVVSGKENIFGDKLDKSGKPVGPGLHGIDKELEGTRLKLFLDYLKNSFRPIPGDIAPPVKKELKPTTTAKPQDKHASISIHQTFNESDLTPEKVAEASARGLQYAYRQSIAQGQVT